MGGFCPIRRGAREPKTVVFEPTFGSYSERINPYMFKSHGVRFANCLPMQSTPFYQDWTFWSFVAAAIAIVLSQIPPISKLISRPKLEFDLYGNLGISQEKGYPNVAATLGIRNTGAVPIRVGLINVQLLRGGKELAVLTALNYLPTPESKQTVFLAPITIQPHSEWIHQVVFFEKLTQSDNKALGQLAADAKADIVKKTEAQRAKNPSKNSVVQLSPELKERIKRLHDSKFIWKAGEFEFEISLEIDKIKEAKKRYRFTLFESDINQMSEELKRADIGAGIAFPDQSKSSIVVMPAPVN